MQLRNRQVLLLILASAASAVFAVRGVSKRERDLVPVDALPTPQWDSVLSVWHDRDVEIPDSARVGVPTTVRVTTTHSDACVRTAGTELNVSDLVATVRPHDFIGTAMPCGAAVTEIQHETAITFLRRGVATIRIERRGGLPLERRIVVR